MKLMTYLLEGTHEALEAAIPARHHAKLLRWRRACVVTDQAVPAGLVRESHAGDHFEALSRRWCDRNLLDDLHDQYVKSSPVPRRKMVAAIEAWEEARERQERVKRSLVGERARHQQKIEDLNQALATAEADEYKSAQGVVRTHGKAPVVIRGLVYDPMLCFNGTTVFYRPRKGQKASGS